MGSYESDEEISDSEPEDDFKINRISTANEAKRVIILLDLDCYEVQLWMKHLRRDDLIGKDIPVVVVNHDQIILSVNYTAKSLGVQRGKGRRGLVEARQVCKNKGHKLIEIVAGERFGKVDTFLPMKESDVVLEALLSWPDRRESDTLVKIERSSRDEFYIDVTNLVRQRSKAPKQYQKLLGSSAWIRNPSHQASFLNCLKVHPNVNYHGTPETVMEGRRRRIHGQELDFRIVQIYQREIEPYHADEVRLVHGAIIAKQLIQRIKELTNYQASAGIGHSKLTAKLACSKNKPQGINIITDISLPRLSGTTSFQKLPGYAGITGENIRNLLQKGSNGTIYDLQGYKLRDLVSVFKDLGFRNPESSALDLHNKCHFRDHSEVTTQVFPATFTTSLSFKGHKRLYSWGEFKRAIDNLSKDMKERIDYYRRMGRRATSLTVKADVDLEAMGSCEFIFGTNRISANKIFNFMVDYYQDSDCDDFEEIQKIHLTAGSIRQWGPLKFT